MTENTLRDQFAMAALTGLLANPGTNGISADTYPTVAGIVYEIADAMVVESRQKPKANEGAEK